MFKKILVPLDGSEHSTRALEKAILIAKKFDGKITLIHAYSISVQPIILPESTTLTAMGMPILTTAEVSKIAGISREAGNRILQDGEEKVKTEGVGVARLLVEGHAVQEIVRAAREGSFDLIIMGARGISKIKEILLGSVSDGVIHHASCPVLLIK